MNMNEEAADLLETTADRFATEEYEWAQGDFQTTNYVGLDRRRGYCALGGLAKTANMLVEVVAGQLSPFQPNNVFGIASRAAALTLGTILEEEDTDPLSVADWNDEQERTVDEVVDLLRHTAKDLRNQAA